MDGFYRYFLLNKPYNMVSQFVSSHPVNLLTKIKFNFPEGTHAIGRLDNDSEGLLLLTTNSKITKLLFESAVKHKRIYKVLVLKKVNQNTVEQIKNGLTILGRGGVYFNTLPCECEIIDEPVFNFPSPYKKSNFQEYTWLKITMYEGKYRQVRKMVASVGHRCVRLIRTSIENIELEDIAVGEVKEISEKDFFDGLNLVN